MPADLYDEIDRLEKHWKDHPELLRPNDTQMLDFIGAKVGIIERYGSPTEKVTITTPYGNITSPSFKEAVLIAMSRMPNAAKRKDGE